MASTDELDITHWRQKGADLHTEIVNAVKSTQSVIIQPLPNILTMTQAQYDSLLLLKNMPEMYQSKERFYYTPLNVMEVRVSNRTKQTFEEAHKLEVRDNPLIGELSEEALQE